MLRLKKSEIPDHLRKYFREAACGQCFVCALVLVFREARRVLHDSGCIWVNLGDAYTNTSCGGSSPDGDRKPRATDKERKDSMKLSRATFGGLPPGNLCGSPWRVALALQADGWILRQDIIWSKAAPMPESVTNRCTKSHEYIFLLAKNKDYFFDNEAIKEPLKGSTEDYAKMLRSKQRQKSTQDGTAEEAGAGRKTDGFNSFISDGKSEVYVPNGRNKRSVWSVASMAYPGAHYATFAPKLIEPMILAGTSEKGCCAVCLSPWKRVVERTFVGAYHDHSRDGVQHGLRQRGEGGGGPASTYIPPKTLGWQPTCTCHGEFVKQRVKVKVQRRPDDEDAYDRDHSQRSNRNGKGSTTLDKLDKRVLVIEKEVEETQTVYVPRIPLEEHPVIPCTVLDPFVGSGTTCCFSAIYGRHSVGIELNKEYIDKQSIPRCQEYLKQRARNKKAAARYGADELFD